MLIMSDSDSDCCDVGVDEFDVRTVDVDNHEHNKNKRINEKGRRVRGKDINWLPTTY